MNITLILNKSVLNLFGLIWRNPILCLKPKNNNMFYIKSTLDNYYIAKDLLSMTSKKEERAIFETKESAKCYIEGTNVFGKLKTVKIRDNQSFKEVKDFLNKVAEWEKRSENSKDLVV